MERGSRPWGGAAHLKMPATSRSSRVPALGRCAHLKMAAMQRWLRPAVFACVGIRVFTGLLGWGLRFIGLACLNKRVAARIGLLPLLRAGGFRQAGDSRRA